MESQKYSLQRIKEKTEQLFKKKIAITPIQIISFSNDLMDEGVTVFRFIEKNIDWKKGIWAGTEIQRGKKNLWVMFDMAVNLENLNDWMDVVGVIDKYNEQAKEILKMECGKSHS